MKNQKKHMQMLSLYMCTINDNHMVPEIWSVTERIFCHFGPFFALLPLKTWKKKTKFWKYEKNPGDIIILHKCTKNQDYMLYCSWDMACDRCNRNFSFWTIFCSPRNSPKKWKLKKKWKKTHWRYHHFKQQGRKN